MLLEGALKCSVHHGNTTFQIGVIQVGTLKMQFPMGIIIVNVKKSKF